GVERRGVGDGAATVDARQIPAAWRVARVQVPERDARARRRLAVRRAAGEDRAADVQPGNAAPIERGEDGEVARVGELQLLVDRTERRLGAFGRCRVPLVEIEAGGDAGLC